MPISRLSHAVGALRQVARHGRSAVLLAGLAALSACAGRQTVDNRLEAQHYAAVAPGHYVAPGPASDPWGPYIVEAAARYDVPQSWIRSVMHQESGGQVYTASGQLVVSDKGAMGLMQVMPETYDELRVHYNLGDDPYDPHNNILAGTAYMREMYDLYGSPGFLAAYNGGPARLDRYLAGTDTLPDETRHYVAAIGPYIMGDMPNSRSPADQLALNQLPLEIPAGLRYSRPSYAVASRHKSRSDSRYASRSSHSDGTRYAASSSTIVPASYHGRAVGASRLDEQPRLQFAMATPRASHGFRLISSAQADVLPLRRGAGTSGDWAVQVGAYGSESQARSAAASARLSLSAGQPAVGSVHQAHGTLYRARLTGLSREAAITACEKHHGGCMVLSPDAQS